MNFDIVSALIGMALEILLLAVGVAYFLLPWVEKLLEGGFSPILQEIVQKMESNKSWNINASWKEGPATFQLQADYTGYTFKVGLFGLNVITTTWSP